MNTRRRPSRSLFVVAGLATVMLTACGASAPPGKELADEIIETLEVDGQPVSAEVKACMHKAVADFKLTDDELTGFKSFDDVAAKADKGQEQAIAIMDRFEAALADCNGVG